MELNRFNYSITPVNNVRSVTDYKSSHSNSGYDKVSISKMNAMHMIESETSKIDQKVVATPSDFASILYSAMSVNHGMDEIERRTKQRNEVTDQKQNDLLQSYVQWSIVQHR